MKKMYVHSLMWLLLLPGLLPAQYLNDYRPMGSPPVGATTNLVSAVTANNGPTGAVRAVNTVREPGMMTTNIWLTQADNLGNLPFSRHFGLSGVNERAAALERCPNGDFIIAATTFYQGLPAVWLFRYSPVMGTVWSYRYLNPNWQLSAFCIRRTNETGADNYVVAASAFPGFRLMLFKIDGTGNLLWNFQYNAVAGGTYSDTPKSLIMSDSTIVVAGNRNTTNALGQVSADLFAIGVNRTTGAIVRPFVRIGDTTRPELDPFITVASSGATGTLAMTYRYTVTQGGVNTGRIAVMRLTAATLNPVNPVYYYSEAGATNSYGHSIYPNGTGFDIGGGTTVGGLSNPVFLSINSAGAALNYRRLWTTLNFNSTYMLRDSFVTANRYLHHNTKALAGFNSMSLLRNPAAAAPCNNAPAIQFFTATVQRQQIAYNALPGLTRVLYPVGDVTLPGEFDRCTGGGGVFKTNNQPAEAETVAAGGAAFQLYPTLLQGNTPVTVAVNARQSGMAMLEIYNLQAKMMQRSKHAVTAGANRLLIQPGPLQPGAYVVELTVDGNTWRTKIVKE